MVLRSRIITTVIAAVVALAGLLVAVPNADAAGPVRPTITKVSPAYGPAIKTTPVTVRGTGFTHVSKVLFGRAPGIDVHLISRTELTVVAPKHDVKRTNVRVVLSDKSAPIETEHTIADQFLYYGQTSVVRLVSSTSTDSSITLRWKNPNRVGFDHVMIRRHRGASAPYTPTQGQLVANVPATQTRYVDTGDLGAGTEYSYTLFAVNAVGQSSKPQSVSAYTLAIAAASTGWSGPAQPFAPQTAVGSLKSSCISGPFCLVSDQAGDVRIYSAGTWSVGPSIGVAAFELACEKPTFCVADTRAGVRMFNGTSWSDAVGLQGDSPDYLSCESSTFCLAMDAESHATFIYDGTTWSPGPAPKLSRDRLSGLGCFAPSDCIVTAAAAEGANGTGSTESEFYAGVWHRPNLFAHDMIFALSCATDSACLTVTDDVNRNDRVIFGSFSHTTELQYLGTRVSDGSCGSTTLCVAIGSAGKAAVFDGTTWSTPSPISSAPGSLDDVSCTSDTFCLISNTAGDVYTRS